jgi:uncharacterized RDD family membrane protein YckC
MAYSMPSHGDPTNVLGRRIAAFLIDALITLAVFVAVLALTKSHSYIKAPGGACQSLRDRGFSGECLQLGSRVYTWKAGGFAAGWLVSLGASIANNVLLQGSGGASVGKLILGLRVVDAGGQICGIGRAFVRWLLLIVDVLFCGLVGLVTASVTHPHRRVGDMAGGTYVVGVDDVGRQIEAAKPAPAYQYGYGQPDPGAWTPPGGVAPGWGGPQPGQPPAAPPTWGAPAPQPQQQGWGQPPAAAPAAGWGQPPAEPPTWGAPPPPPETAPPAWGAPPPPPETAPPAWGAPPPPPPPTPPPPAAPEPAAPMWNTPPSTWGEPAPQQAPPAPAAPAAAPPGWDAPPPAPTPPPPLPERKPAPPSPVSDTPPPPAPAPPAPAPAPPAPTATPKAAPAPPGESWWDKAFSDDEDEQ